MMTEIAVYFLVGFIYSIVMARWFEQNSETDTFVNWLLWAFIIPVNFLVMIWRLAVGYTPSYYKKRHYIWSSW